MLDRTIQPAIRAIESIRVTVPERNIMPNGVNLNIINAGSQEVVRMDILIKGGQWLQEYPLQAMFANRMLREGTIRFTSAVISEKLDYYGAWMELSVSMSHSFLTLYSLNKYFDRTLDIIESIIKEPSFPENELSIVTETNKQQFLVNSTKVDNIAHKTLHHSLFGSLHPCGRFAVTEDYDRIDIDMLKAFYHTFYHSRNCSIYLSGKVSGEIIKSVETAFGTSVWGDGKETNSTVSYPIESLCEKRMLVERSDAMQSALKMGALSIDRTHPDFHKLKVLLTVFGGYFGSRLMSNIREDKGYTYGIASGLISYPGIGMWLITTEAANEYIEPIISEIYREIDILQNEFVSVEELSMVRNYMLGEMCRNYEGPFSLSDAWIFIECGQLQDNFFTESVESTKSITAYEIRELAQKHFVKSALTEVVAGKKM